MTIDDAIKAARQRSEVNKKLNCPVGAQEHLQIALWLEELKESRGRITELTQELAYATGRAYAAEEDIGTLRSQAAVAIDRMKEVLDKYDV